MENVLTSFKVVFSFMDNGFKWEYALTFFNVLTLSMDNASNGENVMLLLIRVSP